MNLLTGLITLYIVWGSTYLAIRVAVASLPPFLMAGSRFFTAGILLYAWLKFREWPTPSKNQWKSAFIVGGYLLLGGNGAVVWAEQVVPSGLTALLVSSVPIWLVLFSWMKGRTARPSGLLAAGIALGFIGVFVLVRPDSSLEASPAFYAGVAALLFASLSWAWGSLYSKTADLPASPWMSTAIQMMAGGGLLLLAGIVHGEIGRIHVASFTAPAVGAWIYLVLLGSLVGYSAYVWVLKKAPIALAGTYAYVNPVVALILGALVLDEKVTGWMMAGAGLVVAGVALITTASARESAKPGV